eukprot:m.36981 g.36981  ORF g.36981 m.36981 type:complete len:324 (+) comp11067_c1_seq1:622-1593(+)
MVLLDFRRGGRSVEHDCRLWWVGLCLGLFLWLFLLACCGFLFALCFFGALGLSALLGNLFLVRLHEVAGAEFLWLFQEVNNLVCKFFPCSGDGKVEVLGHLCHIAALPAKKQLLLRRLVFLCHRCRPAAKLANVLLADCMLAVTPVQDAVKEAQPRFSRRHVLCVKQDVWNVSELFPFASGNVRCLELCGDVKPCFQPLRSFPLTTASGGQGQILVKQRCWAVFVITVAAFVAIVLCRLLALLAISLGHRRVITVAGAGGSNIRGRLVFAGVHSSSRLGDTRRKEVGERTFPFVHDVRVPSNESCVCVFDVVTCSERETVVLS